MQRSLTLLFTLVVAASALAPEADAQQRRRRAAAGAATPGDSTYYFRPRPRTMRGTIGRPISDATTGVLGQDTIKMNERGQYRNLNSNTGQPLPPNNGKVGGL